MELKRQRLAFMMAWHPRLGENALISKFVCKDVGRLIARKMTVGHATDRSLTISLTEPGQAVQALQFSRVKILDHYPNSQPIFQLPCLEILFPLLNPQDPSSNRGKIVVQSYTPSGAAFLEWMKRFEAMVVNCITPLTGHSRAVVSELFTFSVKEQDRYQSRLSLSWGPSTEVFMDRHNKLDIMSAIHSNVLDRRTRVRLLVELSMVWRTQSNRFGCKWNVKQILVTNRPECAFLSDEDE